MISEHLPIFIDRPQNVVLIGFFIAEFPDAETKRGSRERRGEKEAGRKGRVLVKMFYVSIFSTQYVVRTLRS